MLDMFSEIDANSWALVMRSRYAGMLLITLDCNQIFYSMPLTKCLILTFFDCLLFGALVSTTKC